MAVERRAARSTRSGDTATAIAITYKRGDILLRAGEEDWIMTLTGGPYSHAGICVDPEQPNEAADAHPVDEYRTEGNEVARLPIAGFFSKEHAPGGGDVFRYTGPVKDADAAAKWAGDECGKPYTFDLMDPILDNSGTVIENNQLYCSEFVWRSYKYGAGVPLVSEKDFINLLDPSRVDTTVDVLLPIARENGQIPKGLPDFIAKPLLKRELRKRHNGYFIAPVQLSTSKKVTKVHSIRGGAAAPGSAAGGGNK
jgi:Permuted papain-like amidase enzyme, YaeF/YiiX, C92 family